jgi:peptidoglycan/LPS O-acetylase OafA/YrhL
MAAADPSDRHHQVQGPARNRRRPWVTLAILAGLAVNLALCVRRVGGEDRGALAFVGFSHLNLLLLFGAIRRFEASPDGSPARGRARLAVWLLTATLTAAFTWRIGEMMPLGFAIAAWVMAAATVLGGFYMLFLRGDK